MPFWPTEWITLPQVEGKSVKEFTVKLKTAAFWTKVRQSQQEPDQTDDDGDSGIIEDSDSSESSVDSQPEKVPFPSDANVSHIPWQMARGQKGRLHLVCHNELACARCLKLPESDFGMAKAAATGKRWSPRCYHTLEVEHPEAFEWWEANAIESAERPSDSE